MAKILIVEDEREVANILELYLAGWDYKVCGKVSSGIEAIEIAERERPDLVLMDINLEGDMTGMDAAEQIRFRFGIPSIYLTAHGDEVTFRRAMVTEPFGYILKPFNQRELQIVIEMALFKSAEEKEKDKLLKELSLYRQRHEEQDEL